MSGRLPDFLVIGAMRSGTTTLARLLSAHPQVFFPVRKELHYFDQNFEKPLEWYQGWFQAADGNQTPGEATATYMSEAAAPARMARVIPRAQLVAILRNPVDRTYSHYWHERNLGREHLPFREALAAESERTATDEVLPRLRFGYRERSRYFPQLERVCHYYPRQSLHVMILEEFQRDPEAEFRALCAFLGVAESFRPPDLGRRFNRYGQVRSRRVFRMVQRIPWRPLRKAVRWLNVRHVSYPPLDTALRQELVASFERDNRALEDWLGRSVSAWSV
jgi:hypothetical protein